MNLSGMHPDECRWYLDTYGRQMDKSPWRHQKYAPLGWASVIAFPHFFAMSFGDFGSQQVRQALGNKCLRKHTLRVSKYAYMRSYSGLERGLGKRRTRQALRMLAGLTQPCLALSGGGSLPGAVGLCSLPVSHDARGRRKGRCCMPA